MIGLSWLDGVLSLALGGASLWCLNRFHRAPGNPRESRVSSPMAVLPACVTSAAAGSSMLWHTAPPAYGGDIQTVEPSLLVVVGAPCWIASGALGLTLVSGVPARRAAQPDGPWLMWLASGVLLLVLVAAGRIGLLEGQLLVLGGLALCWRDLMHEAPAAAAKISAGSLWLACVLGLAAGLLAGRATTSPVLIPWVMLAVSGYLAGALTIGWGSGVGRSVGTEGLGRLVLWSTVFGSGWLSLTRVVTVVWSQVDASSGPVLERIVTLAESVRAGPYLGSLRALAPEAGLVLFGAIVAWRSSGLVGVELRGPAALLRVLLGVTLLASALGLLGWRCLQAFA